MNTNYTNLDNHIALDLETASIDSNAAIIVIAAVRFNIASGHINVIDTFSADIGLANCRFIGGIITNDTLSWWGNQSPEVKLQLEGRTEPVEALDQFDRWIHQGEDPVGVWGNGVSFDNTILGNAYRRTNRAIPWNYRADRCLRTMKNMFPDLEPRFIGTPHVALDDAAHQAKWITNILIRKAEMDYAYKFLVSHKEDNYAS